MLNLVAIQGRLVADPEVRTTQSGVSVCSFRIACDRSYSKPGEQRQADFFTVIAWRQAADFVKKYFAKGDMIVVDGQLQTRSFENKFGGNTTVVEIVANNVNFAGGKNVGGKTEKQAEPDLQPDVGFKPIDDSDDLPF